MLSDGQQHFAAHFAGQRRPPTDPSFVMYEGLPLLEGALAHLACQVVDIHPAGDHVLWIGEVEHVEHTEGAPLLFYAGLFGSWRDLQPGLVRMIDSAGRTDEAFGLAAR